MLCCELKAQGYHGSERAVYRYLTFLKEQTLSQELPTARLPIFSSKKTTWLLVKEACKLDEEEQEALTTLRQTSTPANLVYPLVQDFGHMVRQRQGERLDEWLTSVEASAIADLQTFAAGIQRDKAAVQAGLTLPYSNGPLEGNVNRLKLIKRSMYGRADIDLLKLRVLHHSKASQDRKKKREQRMLHLKRAKSMKNSATSWYTITRISKVA